VNVRILSVAEVEAAEAALRYEERQPGLGDQFLTEFDHALDRIRRDPRVLGLVENDTGPHELRRCLLHRFPYIVVFLVQSDEAVVVAVGDARRRPFYWLERLN
jgi:hypothetical protein